MNSNGSIIEVNGLSKVFKVHKKEPGLKGSLRSLIKRNWTEKKALHNVSFNIRQGEIVGLIGSNGAGKTTLSKILSGIVHPTHGEVSVLGFVPWERDNNFRRQMALIMGQKASLWWDLPAWDCYLLLKEIYQITDEDFKARLDYLAEMLGVKNLLKIQIRRLSLGERMKMELIATLLHNPKVVFLDEPTIGLDLTAQKAVRHFLLEYRKQYQPAMILTSHYMEDIEQLCERIIVLKEGQIIYDGPLKDITQRFSTEKIITMTHSGCKSQECILPDELGSIIQSNGEILKVKTSKEKVSKTISFLLEYYKLDDINVEESDVSDIIEKIIREGLHT